MPYAKKKQGRMRNKKGGLDTRRAKKKKMDASLTVTDAPSSPNPMTKGRLQPSPSSAETTPRQQAAPVPAPQAEIEKYIEEDKKRPLFDICVTFRHAVAYCYEYKYGSPQDSDETPWAGRGGIISKIRADLNIPKGTSNSTIQAVMSEVLDSKENGTRFEVNVDRSNNGAKCIIPLDSQEAQIIADALESGLSCVKAWTLVNCHREAETMASLTMSAVYNCIKRLKPMVVKIKSSKQGSTDQSAPMCKARFAWCLQLAIRLKLVTRERIVNILRDHGIEVNDSLELPDEYNPQKLSELFVDGFVTWDEVHRKVQPGSDKGGALKTSTKNHILKFPRDQNGKINLLHGTYSDDEVVSMKCKYTDEVRLCLGVAVVTPVINGVKQPQEGRRCHPFVYSGTTLLSIPDYKKKVQLEIQRVKSLKSGYASGWVKIPDGTKDKLYQDDPVLRLKKCGKSYTQKLHDVGVFTVTDLLNVVDYEKLHQDTKIPMSTLMNFQTQCQSCQKTVRPDVIDYRKAENPYLEWYGEENWENEIENTHFMKSYTCITHLIEHIIAESKRVFLGTTHEDTWKFYHDALSLMTAKQTKEWMKKKGYYSRWILPEQNLCYSDPTLKSYRDRPPGNSPELCNLDSNLNEDVHRAVERCVRQTSIYPHDDIRKYSMATPKKGTSAYLRVFHPVDGCAPTSLRILHDTNNVLKAIMMIVEAGGCVVPDINNRTGRRRESGATKSSNHGGHRMRKQKKDFYGSKEAMPADLRSDGGKANDSFLEVSRRLHKGVGSKDVKIGLSKMKMIVREEIREQNEGELKKKIAKCSHSVKK